MSDFRAIKEILAIWASLDLKNRLRDEISAEWREAYQAALDQIASLVEEERG